MNFDKLRISSTTLKSLNHALETSKFMPKFYPGMENFLNPMKVCLAFIRFKLPWPEVRIRMDMATWNNRNSV
jgi:hypothetical protein